MANFCEGKLITRMNVRDYFKHSVSNAVINQHLEASECTIYYLVNLLTTFTRSENFFDCTEEGLMLRPLALTYADAVNADTENERNKYLQRLGDVALFISGLFSSSLNRKSVGLDYYISMGGNAYSMLAIKIKKYENGNLFEEIYSELARKFTGFVNVLSEIGENKEVKNNCDLMRIYEFWLHTGNCTAEKTLKENGIQPVMVGNQKH